MNLSNIDRILVSVLVNKNRPLINYFTLHHVMNYDLGGPKEYSLLLKACFFFYKFGIDDRVQHARLRNYTGTVLPWNIGDEQEAWIWPGVGDHENEVIRERNRKLWFKLLDFNYEIYYGVWRKRVVKFTMR